MCSQVLDGLKMIYLCFKKSNANLVINTTCMLLYLSRAIYIFEWKNLVYKVYFWMSYFSPWFLWVETKKLVIPFLLSILLLAFLSVHCVSHIGDLTNLAGYPPLKPNIIFCDSSSTTTYHWEWIINSRKIARWCQDWRFQVSLQRKSIHGTYLISITSLPEDEQTSKHGGGGTYNEILEFKGEQIN
jgi:hypothetical protein